MRRTAVTLVLLLVAALALMRVASAHGRRPQNPAGGRMKTMETSTFNAAAKKIQIPSNAPPKKKSTLTQSTGGGANCAACTVVVGLIEQLSEIHDQSIEEVVDRFCDLFPKGFIQESCLELVQEYGAQVIEALANKEEPDSVCREIKYCTDPTCQLFSASTATTNIRRHRASAMRAAAADKKGIFIPQWIKDLINKLGNDHEPIFDADNDLYSTYAELRGYSWRGADCDDSNNQVYPGRSQTNLAASVDHNCNGIYGTDPATGQSYEQMFCSGANAPIGVAVLGDSVGAHFSIPPQYLTAADINTTTYDNLLPTLENEFDWPQKSWGTGWVASTKDSPVNSFYLQMRNRNRCMHRDYQNLGVNGDRADTLYYNVIKSLARNQQTDAPLLVIFELVGNDVCSGHHTFDTMTTPAAFESYVLDSLQYLDSTLPAGSHVMFLGLAPGEVLYEILHNQTHPIGVSYERFYDYLNCLNISPCWGWMNSNATVRQFTTERAQNLSLVYQQIIGNYTFKNFDMSYYDFPWLAIAEKWLAQGGQLKDLIEPVDGFHPSGIANALLAEFLFNQLAQDHPAAVGNINPYNDMIDTLFGDQGGYIPKY